VAALLTILMVWLAVFAVNSSLHRAAHADGRLDNDSCAICLFAQSQVSMDIGAVALFVVAMLGFHLLLSVYPPVYFSIDLLLLPERGPPVFCSSRVR
jgi:hypothetical protein